MDGLLKVDVCSRIPYGVKAISMYSSSGGEEVTGLYPDGKFFLGENRKIVHSSIKPILFPVSCLTEEIQFHGEKIVPLIQLAKIDGHLEEIISVESKYDCLYVASGRMDQDKLEFIFDSSDQSFTVYNNDDSSPSDVLYSLKMYDWLNSHMIDYRGLIDKGLAKSVFDLKENPYE